MGLWDFFFGKKHSTNPIKSQYLPETGDPVDIKFVKNFISNGGYFLYNESIYGVFAFVIAQAFGSDDLPQPSKIINNTFLFILQRYIFDFFNLVF